MIDFLLNAPIDDSQWNFNWGIHLVTIPMTIAIGVLIGWVLRDKKAANDDARRELDKSTQ
jgi:hypothetical protein